MGTKKRIFDLHKQRNSLNLVSLGDKPYKNPEYSFQFFKEGGLVPGASNKTYRK